MFRILRIHKNDGGIMGARSWISFVGNSPVAVINTIWAACKEGFVPGKIHLIYTSGEHGTRKFAIIVRDMLHKLLPYYDITDPEIVLHEVPNEPKINEYSKVIESILKEETNEVAVDITPGRKFMSVFLYHIALRFDNVTRIYYLLLKDTTYQNSLYPTIPMPLLALFNMKK